MIQACVKQACVKNVIIKLKLISLCVSGLVAALPLRPDTIGSTAINASNTSSNTQRSRRGSASVHLAQAGDLLRANPAWPRPRRMRTRDPCPKVSVGGTSRRLRLSCLSDSGLSVSLQRLVASLCACQRLTQRLRIVALGGLVSRSCPQPHPWHRCSRGRHAHTAHRCAGWSPSARVYMPRWTPWPSSEAAMSVAGGAPSIGGPTSLYAWDGLRRWPEKWMAAQTSWSVWDGANCAHTWRSQRGKRRGGAQRRRG